MYSTTDSGLRGPQGRRTEAEGECRGGGCGSAEEVLRNRVRRRVRFWAFASRCHVSQCGRAGRSPAARGPGQAFFQCVSCLFVIHTFRLAPLGRKLSSQMTPPTANPGFGVGHTPDTCVGRHTHTTHPMHTFCEDKWETGRQEGNTSWPFPQGRGLFGAPEIRWPPDAGPLRAGGRRMRLLWYLWMCIGCQALSWA